MSDTSSSEGSGSRTDSSDDVSSQSESYERSSSQSESYEGSDSSQEESEQSSSATVSPKTIFERLTERTQFLNTKAYKESNLAKKTVKELRDTLLKLQKEQEEQEYEEELSLLLKRKEELLDKISRCENKAEYEAITKERDEKQRELSTLKDELQDIKATTARKNKSMRDKLTELNQRLSIINMEIKENKALIEKLSEIKKMIEDNNGVIPREVIKEHEEEIERLEDEILLKRRKILELELGKTEREVENEFSLYSKRKVDRSDWYLRLFRKHPEIQELRERVNPLRRAMAMAKYYSKSKVEVDMHLTQNVINTLILQHLDFTGNKEIYDYLKKTLGVNTNNIMPLNHSRLVRLIEIAIRDTEQLYNLLLKEKEGIQEEAGASTGGEDGDKAKDRTESEIDMSGINALISDIGLDQKLGDGDVNIWDEPDDCPENIVYSPEDGTTIWYANENKLIEKLTSANTSAVYVSRFIMAYQSFMTNEYLFYKLQQRYNVPDMNHPSMKRRFSSEKEYLKFKEVVKIRVIAALDKVVKENFDDLGEKLLLRIESFARDVILSERGSRIVLSTLEKMRKEKTKAQITYDFDEIATPKLPDNVFSPKLDLNDVDEQEFARQITLYVFDLYQRIKPSELITLAWSKKEIQHRKAPNIMRLIAQFNNFSNWVTQSIVLPKRAKKRAKMFERFVKIGEYCLELNNFNTLMTLIAGMGDPSVNRLKYTKQVVKQRYLNSFESFKELMNQKEGSKTYKERLKKVSGPCVPYVGVYLTDLTFKNDANPSKVNGLINFLKSVKLISVIEEIKEFQALPYSTILPIDQIQWLLRREFEVLSTREIWAKSNEREPKGADKSQIKM